MAHTLARRQRGITLVEVSVGLAITTAVLQLALPALRDLVASVRLQAVTSELLSDLELARSEAVKRNGRVTLCKSPDGLACAAQGGWEQGWIVFGDRNRNGVLDAGEEKIARREALGSGLHVAGNTPVARYISYTPVGASKLTGGGFQAGTVTLCRRSAEPTDSRQLVLNAFGRPRVQKGTVAFCG